MRTICSCFGRWQLPINTKGQLGLEGRTLRRMYPISALQTAKWYGCSHLRKRNLRVSTHLRSRCTADLGYIRRKPGKCRVFIAKDCWFGRWLGYALGLYLVTFCSVSSDSLCFSRNHSETLGVALREALRKTIFQFYVFTVCVH